MAELIFTTEDGSIGFGDFTLQEKTKVSDFKIGSDSYKVKTFKDLTRLERNEMFVYESEPGTRVTGLKVTGDKVSFAVEGNGATSIILGLEDSKEYKVTADGVILGRMTTDLGGKLVLSVDLALGRSQMIEIERM